MALDIERIRQMFCKKTQETIVKPETVKEAEPKVSVWDRFGAAERQRRIAEFIAADKEALDAEFQDMPSIADRGSYCPRCDQGRSRQHVSTVGADRAEYQIAVREIDGELILSKGINWSRYVDRWAGYPYGREPTGPMFTVESPMYLLVSCECGKQQRFRALAED